MAKTFTIKNRLPYHYFNMPELLPVLAGASVHFSNPITPLKNKCLNTCFKQGFFKECMFVLGVYSPKQLIKPLFQRSALLGGNRNNNGKFNNLGNNGNFWSSSENNSENAWNLNMNSNNKKANVNNNNKSWGFSVRCLQHWTIWYGKAVFLCN
jgi:hypothetical protein